MKKEGLVEPSFLVQRASLVASVRSQQSGHCRMGILPELLTRERLDLRPADEPNDEGATRCADQGEGRVVGPDGVYAADGPVFDLHSEKYPSRQGHDQCHGATDCPV